MAITVRAGIRGRDVHAIGDDSRVPGTKNRPCIRIYDFAIQRLLAAGIAVAVGGADAEYAMGQGDASTA